MIKMADIVSRVYSLASRFFMLPLQRWFSPTRAFIAIVRNSRGPPRSAFSSRFRGGLVGSTYTSCISACALSGFQIQLSPAGALSRISPGIQKLFRRRNISCGRFPPFKWAKNHFFPLKKIWRMGICMGLRGVFLHFPLFRPF